jgi:hypothetical protein
MTKEIKKIPESFTFPVAGLGILAKKEYKIDMEEILQSQKLGKKLEFKIGGKPDESLR